MAFPAAPVFDADRVPIHRLFPEQYEASKRMIVRDFALIGVTLVSSVLLAALVNANI